MQRNISLTRPSYRLAQMVVLAVAASFITLPMQAQNFSGQYSLQNRKDKSTQGRGLEVVQSESSIEVTEIDHGKRTTNLYPLNGPEGDYASPGGVRGKCKARSKGKQLILESIVLAQPQGAEHPQREHTLQKWQLSSDGKLLSIQTDVDFPDFPPGISAAVADVTSGKEKYVRIDPH